MLKGHLIGLSEDLWTDIFAFKIDRFGISAIAGMLEFLHSRGGRQGPDACAPSDGSVHRLQTLGHIR